MHYVPSNRREVTQWYSITSQKSGNFSNTTVRNPNRALYSSWWKNIFQVLSYVPHISLVVMCFIMQIPMYQSRSMTLRKSFCVIMNCCLCVSLNISHVGELLKHKSTITPSSNQSLCTTLCIINYTLISSSTRFDICWCRQEVQPYCNSLSTHLKSDFISNTEWL